MLLDLSSATITKELSTYAAWALTYSWDGKKLAGNTGDSFSWVWDLTAESLTHVLRGHTSRVFSLFFSHNSETIASCSTDQTVRLWDLRIEKYLTTTHDKFERNGVQEIAFSPNGRLLVSGHDAGCLKFWDLTSALPNLQQTGATCKDQTDWVRGVVFSSDGSFLVSCCGHEVKFWHQHSGRWIIKYVLLDDSYDLEDDPTGGNRIAGIYLSTDDKLLAFETHNSRYRIWDICKCEYICTLHPATDCAPEEFLRQAGYDFNNQYLDPYRDDSGTGERTRLLTYTHDNWVSRNGKKLLWVPPSHRGAVAVYRDIVALGLYDGRVILLQLSSKDLDRAGY